MRADKETRVDGARVALLDIGDLNRVESCAQMESIETMGEKMSENLAACKSRRTIDHKPVHLAMLLSARREIGRRPDKCSAHATRLDAPV